MKNYDLAIIGSGPGGYVAGLYASRRGLKVCVIEKDATGGTCLNRGCIPTKSLLNSVSILSKLKTASIHGIVIDGYHIDFGKMMARKDEVVTRLRVGIETLLKANKIDLYKGPAKLSAPDLISLPGIEEIRAKNIIIATGSRVASLSSVPIDDIDILSSDSILTVKSAPQSLAIIGGGVIGCEFACLFGKLGTKVTIIEMMDRLIPAQSKEVSRKLEFLLKKSGVEVHTLSTVESVDKADGILHVNFAGGKKIHAEKILVSVGRLSNVENLGIEGIGIKTLGGKIKVDDHLRTDVPSIFAIGDCIQGPQLAHRASYDGILACDNILGSDRRADYANIPNCIWTEPEIASVGLTEEAARSRFPDIRIAKFPYLASGKAYIEGDAEGFVKIVGTPEGVIVGVEIFGKDACNLISEAAVARASGMTISEWAHVVHGHPTLSEILQEACHVFCGTPIHSI